MLRVTPPVFILIALSACSGSGEQGQAPSQQNAAASSSAAEPPANFSIEYGRHYPNGRAAVDYLVGPDGMWKEMTSLQYVWNYYSQCAEARRPYDREALIEAADGTRFFTAPDADCNLLLDLDGDGELESSTGAHAFHEHNGRGLHGQKIATPFTTFWFDDNWLARLVTDTYGSQPPDGLRGEAESVRWRVLRGSGGPEDFYGDVQFDRLALDGLRYLSRHDVAQALAQWNHILERSGYFHDGTTRGFAYPLIDENYHLGLFQILTALLMDRPELPSGTRDELLQHWVAVRANILSNQEREGSKLLGWRSSIGDGASLMNTETISIGVLALGAGALDVFEAGCAPLEMDDHGYVRGETYLSARAGEATPGYITAGPNKAYPPGVYEVQFVLRAAGGTGPVARLEAKDVHSDRVLASDEILQAELPGAGQWASVVLSVKLTESLNSLSLRTYWNGQGNMDVAAVRLRHRGSSM